jgi:type IV pilus assembly protein PilE
LTLIELMIVVAILAVLATMAWPSFQQAIQRSRRADAMAALGEIMQAQERWRANNPTFQSSLADLPGARSTSVDGHYALSLSPIDVDAAGRVYMALARVRSTSPQSGDKQCQALRVRIEGGNITYSSLAAGDAVNATPDPCWVR